MLSMPIRPTKKDVTLGRMTGRFADGEEGEL